MRCKRGTVMMKRIVGIAIVVLAGCAGSRQRAPRTAPAAAESAGDWHGSGGNDTTLARTSRARPWRGAATGATPANNPYARHAAVMNARTEDVVDVTRNGGAFYVVQVPPGERVALDVPAMCLDYSRAVPTSGTLAGGLGDARPLVAQMVAVQAHMVAHADAWEQRLDRDYGLRALHGQVVAQPLGADMRALEEVNADLERLLRDMRGGNLQTFATGAQRVNEIADRALRAMERMNKPVVPANAPPLTPAQRRETAIAVLDRALQWAAWREDPKFEQHVAERVKRAGPASPLDKALDRLSYIIREAARARNAAGDGAVGS